MRKSFLAICKIRRKNDRTKNAHKHKEKVCATNKKKFYIYFRWLWSNLFPAPLFVCAPRKRLEIPVSNWKEKRKKRRWNSFTTREWIPSNKSHTETCTLVIWFAKKNAIRKQFEKSICVIFDFSHILLVNNEKKILRWFARKPRRNEVV